jgi:hypothetical protein
VVQVIETMANMESRVLAKVRSRDMTIESWSHHERRAWMAAFWSDLSQYLNKWQSIKMRLRPGEHITWRPSPHLRSPSREPVAIQVSDMPPPEASAHFANGSF